jgi:hypothetical protein
MALSRCGMLTTAGMILDAIKASSSYVIKILYSSHVIKLVKSKGAGSVINKLCWPSILNTDDMANKKLGRFCILGALRRSVSLSRFQRIDDGHGGRYKNFSCHHNGLLPITRQVALLLEQYRRFAFLCCLSSVYSGHHSILIRTKV